MAPFDRTRGLVLAAVAALVGACADGADPFSAPDSGIPDSGSDTDTDVDTDADADTDTGESEIPPDLPALCAAEIFNAEVSGDGDNREPEIEHAAAAATSLVAWTLDPQETADEQWRIEAGPYDPAAPDVAPVEPFSPAAVASDLALAVRDGGFAAVWLDSRWDPDCSPAAPDDCTVELAFAALDASGAAAAAEPTRLTTDGVVRARPSLAGTADGWLAAWVASDESDGLSLMALPLSADGVPGAAQLVSGDEVVAIESADVALAATPDLATVVWRRDDLEAILAQAVSLAGSPIGEPTVVDEGVQMLAPRIAAGVDGFAVVWSRRTVDDFEVFARLLTAGGAPTGEMRRLTWTTSDESGAVVAWSGAAYGVFWLGNRANGTAECVDPGCDDQAFASLIDADGALASVPVLLSDNVNASSNGDIAWDGSGWTALWELRGNLRQRVFMGRMTCE